MTIQKRKRNLILAILIAAGICILFYPAFSNRWNEKRADALSAQYSTEVQTMDASELDRMREAAQSYNKNLIGSIVPDAFSEREENRDPEYEELLDPGGNGVMGTVEIPVIQVDLPIYHYTTEEVLEKGAGHLAGSSLPVGGSSTHAVISAHRGLPSARMFTDLDRLKKGNVFYLHVLEETLAYEVDQIKVVEPDQTDDLSIEEREDLCTLLTCTPYGVNTQRLLVRGHRIPYDETQYEKENNTIAAPGRAAVLARALCVAAGAGIAAVIVGTYIRRVRKKERKEEKRDEEEA